MSTRTNVHMTRRTVGAENPSSFRDPNPKPKAQQYGIEVPENTGKYRKLPEITGIWDFSSTGTRTESPPLQGQTTGSNGQSNRLLNLSLYESGTQASINMALRSWQSFSAQRPGPLRKQGSRAGHFHPQTRAPKVRRNCPESTGKYRKLPEITRIWDFFSTGTPSEPPPMQGQSAGKYRESNRALNLSLYGIGTQASINMALRSWQSFSTQRPGPLRKQESRAGHFHPQTRAPKVRRTCPRSTEMYRKLPEITGIWDFFCAKTPSEPPPMQGQTTGNDRERPEMTGNTIFRFLGTCRTGRGVSADRRTARGPAAALHAEPPAGTARCTGKMGHLFQPLTDN